MKTHFLLLPALLAAPFASGATFLVDLNTTSAESRPGGTWNEYAAPSNIDGSVIVDSSGTTTSATLSKVGTINDHGSEGAVIYDPSTTTNPSWVSAPGSNGAAGDYFFTGNTNAAADSYTLTFGNLLAGSAVSLDLLASRNNGSAFGFFDYSLDGGATWIGFTVLNPDGTAAGGIWSGTDTKAQSFSLNSQGHALHLYMNMSGTLASGVSALSVRVKDGNTDVGTFSGMNALRLTGTAIPEPSSAALLVLGAAGFVSRRRR